MAGEEAAGRSATVLVVDDNEDLVRIVTHFLARHGLHPSAAHSGRECLDIVRREVVDVVILDVLMPGMSGLEVCEELRRIAPSLPIILLTGRDDMRTRAAGMALGVSEFIAKPFSNQDLLARVQTQIRMREWEREADETIAAIGESGKTK